MLTRGGEQAGDELRRRQKACNVAHFASGFETLDHFRRGLGRSHKVQANNGLWHIRKFQSETVSNVIRNLGSSAIVSQKPRFNNAAPRVEKA